MARLYHITKALSIGMHVCAYLASEDDTYTSTRKVAEVFGFSAHHVTKIVQKLNHANVIKTVRGAKGGFHLAREAEKITLLDIADALGTEHTESCLLHPSVCTGNQCLLGRMLNQQSDSMRQLMSEVTIKELAESLKKSDCTGFATPFKEKPVK